MIAYYNEIDPFAAEWLRNLIKAGHITQGDVDERDIREVQPEDVRGYDRVHWFAGIGGWDLALELAGWGDDPVWTGSPPCQPYSAAGKRKGNADERNLWPAWFELIKACQPQHIAGEQVASAIGHGWIDGISNDLEKEGYATGAVVLPACFVGAPHIRQRLWWVADSERHAAQPGRASIEPSQSAGKAAEGAHAEPGRRGLPGRLGDSSLERCHGQQIPIEQRQEVPETFWSSYRVVPCADGKARRIKPGIEPLAHGVPGRVGQLRGYGNAIVPQVAAEVIKAWRSLLC